MTARILLLLLAGLLGLAACTGPEPETYPLSDAPCAENDPVKDIEPLDCVPAM